MNNTKLSAKVITLYPEFFPGPLSASVTGRALKEKIWSLEVIDLRNYGRGIHKQVDDKPISGGPGMILKPDVLDEALLSSYGSIGDKNSLTVCMSPKGSPLTQDLAKNLLQYNELVIVCGRFEGIDQRVIEKHKMKEISIGDFILTGGELAAMVLLDTVVRLLPGTLGNAESILTESFTDGLLEAPQFTKPIDWNGVKVPEILRTGDHQKILEWKNKTSEQITKINRPDLFIKYVEKKKKMIKRKYR
ncbi:MAG: tRNA (guanosine(37)-N1)-methyltransferase TrmD [Paracoccaceae bacterium]